MWSAVDLLIVFLLSVNTSWTAADKLLLLYHSPQTSLGQTSPDQLSSPADTAASHGTQARDRNQPGHDQHVWSASNRKLHKVDDKTSKASDDELLAGYDSDIPPHLLLKDLSAGFSSARKGASSAPKGASSALKGTSSAPDGASSSLNDGRRKLVSISALGG